MLFARKITRMTVRPIDICTLFYFATFFANTQITLS